MTSSVKTLIAILLMTSITTNIQATDKDNPLLNKFQTPHETAPFNLIKNEHYLPAIKASIEEARKDIDQIVTNKAIPDFENTIVALDQVGELLGRIQAIFYNLMNAETNSEMQKFAQEIAPLVTEFSNDINLNETLFSKIESVYNQKEKLGLNTEQSTLLENTYQRFVRNGAKLNDAEKEKYREITKELSQLSLKFDDNVLAETNAFELQITDQKDLSGLPAFVVEDAAQTAKAKNREGWIFTLQYPSYGPFMKYSDNRPLREKMFRAYLACGNRDNEFDNKKNIKRIANLRLEKARLLGYSSHAEWQLKRRMAETPARVNQFLNELHLASRPFAKKEYAEVQAYAEKMGFSGEIQRWDWSYYSEKLKNEKYGFNEEEVKPYLKLENVISGVFGLAKQLYGINLVENKNIPVYHPDVKAYEVFGGDGRFLSVLYMDFHPRDSKQAGAWMNDFRSQSNVGGKEVRPHVYIVMNFTKPTETNPSLITFDELTTFLHEFGHALHSMLSQCTYSGLSGTSVYRDFVELPSQMHENWAYEKDWLNQFAVHYQTGEKIPDELIAKILRAKNFQAAYFMERQLSFGMLDMAYYARTTPVENIAAIEKEAMASTSLFDPIPGSLQSTSFSHIFGGGYDAGYYSYKWAEVLDADAFSVFDKNGIFDKKTADSFRKNILEKGGSEHPMNLYKAFRGQEPTIDALLERSGLKK